jgi:hypothetical protein
MDKGTELDYIADLMTEREALLKQIRQLKQDQKRWERIARKAFEMHGGCLPLCRRACMCDCGYELYHAMIRDENKNG